MRFSETPPGPPDASQTIRRFDEGAYGRKLVHLVPSCDPLIGEEARQWPCRLVFRKPAIILKIIFVQFASLPVHDYPHSLQQKP